MKKTILITFLTSLMLLTPTVVKAEEEVSSATNETIKLSATVASGYTVRFPRTVDVTSKSKQFNIDFKGDISAGEKIVLTTPSSVTLKEKTTYVDYGREVVVTVANSKAEFIYSDLAKDTYNEVGGRSQVTLTHDELKSGTWEGNFVMTIGIVERLPDDYMTPED